MQTQFQSCNPRTEEVLRRFSLLTEDELAARVAEISSAQKMWRAMPLVDRADAITRVGKLLEENAESYAQLIEMEMGKLHVEAVAEVKKCAALCAYSAALAKTSLLPSTEKIEGASVSVRHDALGVILAVMPWNFPFWQFFRAVAPLLLSGNAVLLKHAPNMPQCALAIEEMFSKALPSLAIVRSLFIDNEQIRALIGNTAVAGVTLTGSKRAGIAVASAAARVIKPCVLELGGSDPFIVFADADIENAVQVAVNSRCIANGQSCIAAKRFFVEHSIFDRFVSLMTKQMSERVIGPLANETQQDTLASQVDDAIAKGAKVHCGGDIELPIGYFYPPTVLSNVNATMRVSSEEVFGPVAPVFSFQNDDEAIELANKSDFGLGATVFTSSPERIKRVSEELECGQVFVNDMVRSDQRFPFGGVKESGFGRELGTRASLSFTNEKTVWVKEKP